MVIVHTRTQVLMEDAKCFLFFCSLVDLKSAELVEKQVACCVSNFIVGVSVWFVPFFSYTPARQIVAPALAFVLLLKVVVTPLPMSHWLISPDFSRNKLLALLLVLISDSSSLFTSVTFKALVGLRTNGLT